MNGQLGRLALLACVAAWLPGVTSAAVLSDNLSNPADFSRPFSDTSWVAQEFATTATEFTVNSITVPLSKAVNATGTAQLSIFSSVSGLPGSSLALFATTDIATQVTTASTNYTFSGSTVTLAPSTSYYLVLNALPGISGAVRWGGTFDTTGIGFPSAYSQNNFSGSSGLWTGRALTQPNRMRIEAVPEPSTYAMALAGLACGGFAMWRRRKGQRGQQFCSASVSLSLVVALLCAGRANAEIYSFTNYTTANGLGSNFTRGGYASGGKVYAATNGGLGVTADGGNTWTNYNSENGLGSDLIMSVYVSGSTIYAGTYFGGLSVSNDDGANWTTYTGVGDDRVLGVYAVGSTIYAATSSGLGISTNGGATWTTYTTTNGLGNNYVDGVYASGGTIYAATNNGVSVSTSGGATFTNYTTQNGLGADYVWGVFATGTTIYAATEGGLGVSTNGGANWTNYTSANGLGSDFVRGVYASGSTIYAAFDSGEPGGVSISADGGASWTTYTTDDGLGSNQVLGVYAVGSTVYAATRSGLSIGVAAVPEPATYAMAFAGIACGGFSMWRRRKRA